MKPDELSSLAALERYRSIYERRLDAGDTPHEAVDYANVDARVQKQLDLQSAQLSSGEQTSPSTYYVTHGLGLFACWAVSDADARRIFRAHDIDTKGCPVICTNSSSPFLSVGGKAATWVFDPDAAPSKVVGAVVERYEALHDAAAILALGRLCLSPITYEPTPTRKPHEE